MSCGKVSGVVIIFGICFATVLTLVVVPVMYSIFEGMRYSIVSAFRGPRWKEAPKGTCFYFSRRRHIRLGLFSDRAGADSRSGPPGLTVAAAGTQGPLSPHPPCRPPSMLKTGHRDSGISASA